MKTFLLKTITTVLIVSCLAWSTVAMAAEQKSSDYPVLQEFTAKTLDGETVTEEVLQDADVTMLYFWATYCGYCIDEMPDIASFISTMPDNVQMLTICGDGTRQNQLAEQILEEKELPVPTIIDADQDLLKLFAQTIYTPTLYFVDREGNIIGDPLVGAPKDLETVYSELLENVFTELDLEPVYEDDTEDDKDAAAGSGAVVDDEKTFENPASGS